MTLEFRRSWTDPELDPYRDTVARFIEEQMLPQDRAARERGHVGHEIWRSAGALGRPIAELQDTKFKLAEVATQIAVGRAFIDRCVEALLANRLDPATASMAKLWASEAQGRVVDECVQLFGGYGYMMEYRIARMYVDARVQRIYGGISEIMKEVISRSL